MVTGSYRNSFFVEYHPDIHKTPSHYYGQILDQVDLMEELGYDTVWFSEHHCAGYSFGNPAVIAAAAAARTKRIRIGTGVSLLPLHHPILLAEQYGMLDVLSGGRLEYGVGRGYLMQEYDWLKVPIDESHSRYREAAEFIIKAWTEQGPISFHGEHFDVDNYSYFPQPVQRPHPPIYASAAGTQASFEWAAAKGLNLGTALFGPPLEMIRDNVRDNGEFQLTRAQELQRQREGYLALEMTNAQRFDFGVPDDFVRSVQEFRQA